MDCHTILLLQTTSKPESRSWSDYDTVTQCLEAVCKVYEEHLKRTRRADESHSYDVAELFDFIDRLGDVTCMVLDPVRHVYMPRSVEWIKEELLHLLRKRARHSGHDY